MRHINSSILHRRRAIVLSYLILHISNLSLQILDFLFKYISLLLQGISLAFNTPAWQVLTPRLVPREELTEAIALNGVQFNLARVVGPALAGLILLPMLNGAFATIALIATWLLAATGLVAGAGGAVQGARGEPGLGALADPDDARLAQPGEGLVEQLVLDALAGDEDAAVEVDAGQALG